MSGPQVVLAALPWTYPAVMILAVAVAAGLSRSTQQRLPLSPGQRLGLGLGAFCGAMLGAKLPFVLADPDAWRSGWVWLRDGKTILGGLVGGYFGVEAMKWALGVRIKTGDSYALPVAVGVAIGRVACFVGGCCYGTPTALPWGVVFAHVDDVPRHPAQLYEATFHGAMALLLWQLQRKDLFPRQRLKLYLMAYLVFRFFSETWRPEARLAVGLTGYQWAALGLLPVFAWLWARDARQLRKERSQPPLG